MLVEPRVFRFADIEAHRHSHVVILKARGVACLSGLGECDERAKSVVKGLAEELDSDSHSHSYGCSQCLSDSRTAPLLDVCLAILQGSLPGRSSRVDTAYAKWSTFQTFKPTDDTIAVSIM